MKRSAASRLAGLARAWRVAVERVLETTTSRVAFGTREGRRVVLEVVRSLGDESDAGEVPFAMSKSGSLERHGDGGHRGPL